MSQRPTTAWEQLQEAAQQALSHFERSSAIQRLLRGQLEVDHYAACLREFAHYTRDNPARQAAMTLEFRGTRRAATKRMLAHAASEVDHDLLALEDLTALGRSVDDFERSRPLPTTMPLMALPAWHLHEGNPIGYLGQILFLELMPSHSGSDYLAALEALGVPEDATRFVREHTDVDPQHVRLMEQHVRDLVLDADDLRACCDAVDYAAWAYATMLDGAFAAADASLSQESYGRTRNDGTVASA